MLPTLFRARFAPLAIVIAMLLPACGDETGDEQLAKALESPTELQFDEKPLPDVVAHLRKLLKINVVVDSRALDDVGIDPKARVSVQLKRAKLKTGLRLMLNRLELTFQVRDDVLVITTPDVAAQHLKTVVYDVKKLIDDNDALLETITTVISPDSWDEVGGAGTISAFNGVLVISQTAEVHDRIVALLHDLRADGGGGRSPLHRTLDKRIELEFKETPLHEMIEGVATAAGCDSFIDTVAIDQIGLVADQPVTLKLSGPDPATVLLDALAQLSLTVQVDGSVLVVTTIEKAESRLPAVVYNVRELMAGTDPEQNSLDFDKLLEVILGTVAADSWDDVGGSGSVVVFRQKLIIAQTDANHHDIFKLLHQLRQGAKQTDSAVDKALNSRGTLQYSEVPLTEVLELLSKQFHVEFSIDRKSLTEAGIDPGTRVSGNLKNARFSTLLSFLLRPLDLTIVPDGRRIIVTTDEDAEARLQPRVYSTADLPGGMTEKNIATLIEMITTSVSPDYWDEVGGAGSAVPFRNLLVISQTHDVHAKVRLLLEQLRQVHRQRSATNKQ